ncbi:MAG: hypothetical protein WC384_18480 [Prolixibacteraceae bacterium]|jgi:hypothetical protein
MKKSILGLMAAFMLFLFNPGKLEAENETAKASSRTNSNAIVKSSELNSTEMKLSEIKTIGVSTLNSSETKELLKESNPLQDDQGRRGRGYHQRHNRRDVDVTIRADRSNRYGHSGAYIGGGGVLILILVLILVL